MTTTASRSCDYMRKDGWMAETVEKRVFNMRRDLLGIGDVLAFKPLHGIVIVQAYRKGAEKEHEHLRKNHPIVNAWIKSGGRFLIHEWNKKAIIKKNGMKGRQKDGLLILPRCYDEQDAQD